MFRTVDHELKRETFTLSTKWSYGAAYAIGEYSLEGIASFAPVIGQGFIWGRNKINNLIDIVTGSNFKKVYDSAESINGAGIAFDILSLALPAASKGRKLAEELSKCLNLSQVAAKLIPGALKDLVVQSLLNMSSEYSVLGEAQTTEEAIELGIKFSDAAVAYYLKGLEEQGISIDDWASAVKDVMQGETNDLYNQVMEEE